MPTGQAGSAPATANWFNDIGSGYGTGEIEQTTSSTRNVYQDGHGHLVLKAIRAGATWTSARIESTRDDFRAPARCLASQGGLNAETNPIDVRTCGSRRRAR